MTEVDPRLQALDEAERIALGVAGRIPPAFTAVADDQDLALSAAILQAELGALLPVEHPGRQCTLEHDGAMHLVAQLFDFRVAHGRSLRLSAGARLSGLGLLFAPALPTDREAGALQGRAERAGAPRRTLVGAAGASGSHGGQQLRLFNAHYDEYGFQPIVVFDGEGRFVTAVLRPAKRPSGKEIKPFLRRLLRAIRAHWPNTEILLRADSHYCGREVLDWCRANGLDYILGIAPTATLRRHVEGLEASTKARFEAAPRDGKLRRFIEFFDGAQSWSRVERIIARVEAGAEGPDTRFVVTNLSKRDARRLYVDVYCRRGQAENHIKSWKTHLAADRTSCSKATANQFRLFLHAGAYWLMWGLRVSMPKRSMWRVAQFDTLRLRLIKIAARIVEMKTMIRVHLPTSCPAQDILRFALGRIPRLVT